jgi:hypothetical protein
MFINCGFADEDERVRAEVLNAALEIIDVHGMPWWCRPAARTGHVGQLELVAGS